MSGYMGYGERQIKTNLVKYIRKESKINLLG